MKWFFKRWQDGDINVQKTLTLTSDTILTAFYEEGFTLAISSTPINVDFIINQAAVRTPFNQTLLKAEYLVTMPETVANYKFKQWNDESTNRMRVINLNVDTSLTAIYEVLPPVTHNLVITSSPIEGVLLTVDGYQYSTPTQPLALQEGAHIIVAPSNLLVDSNIYNFVQWEDGSTNPTRTVSLLTDMTITCTYQLQTPPPSTKGFLEIHAFLNSQELVAQYEIVGITTGNTPDKVELDVGTYEVKVTSEGKTKLSTATITEGQTIRLDFQFGAAPKPRAPIIDILTQFPFIAKIYERINAIRDRLLGGVT